MLLIFGAALAGALIVPPRADDPRRVRLLGALACLIAVPRPFVLPTAYEVPGSPFKARLVVERTIVDTVAFIRSLALPPPVQVLTLTDSDKDESPSFAPNGRMILLSTVTGGRGVLSAVSSDGRVKQRLSIAAGDVREPAWGLFIQ